MDSGLKSINTGKGKAFLIIAFIVTLLVSVGFVASLFLLKIFSNPWFGIENVTFYSLIHDEMDLLINTIKAGGSIDAIFEIITLMIIEIFFAITMFVFIIRLIVHLCSIGKYKLFITFKMVKSFFFFFLMMCIAFLVATVLPLYLNLKVFTPSSLNEGVHAVSPNYPYMLTTNSMLLYGGGAFVCILLTMIAGLTCPDIRMGGKHNLICLFRFMVYGMVIATLLLTPAFTLAMSVDGEYASVSNTIIGGDYPMIDVADGYFGYLGGGIFFTVVPCAIMWLLKPIKWLTTQNADYTLEKALGGGKNYYNRVNANRCKGSIKIRLLVTGIIYTVIHFALAKILELTGAPIIISEFSFFLGFGISMIVGGIVLIVFEKILESTSPKTEITFGNK